MGFWGNDGFLRGLTRNVIKWWQFVQLPILYINNNKKQKGKGRNDEIPHTRGKYMQAGEPLLSPQQGMVEQKKEMTASKPDETQVSSGMSELAKQKVEQMRYEEEERLRREVEMAKEQARIASILNANKVDVNAFIEAGKARRIDLEEMQRQEEINAGKQEDTRRAEEIIERLNREAAEDEAKKQAEIEAAKQKAKETFG